MTYDQLQYDVDEGVLTLTLHRPDQLNAFTNQMKDELIDAVDRADADDDVRAVVVTGSGRAFCAGADISGGGETFSGRHESADRVHRDGGGEVSLRIFESTKPFIAAFNGAAVGVGVTMTLPMDIRIASESAKFGFVFTRRGIVPEAASSWFLPRVVGINAAMEWVATGRIFGPAEALTNRLVSRVVAPDELIPTARAIAAEIVAHTAPVSVALSRQMLWRMLGADHPMEAHKLDSRLVRARGRTSDAVEGVESFLEKRPARYPDRVSTDMPPEYPWWTDRPFS